MIEEWRDIEGYEGKYQVSNKGRIKSILYVGKMGSKKINKIRSLTKHRLGYLYIDLYKDNNRKRFYVHRLVGTAFIINTDINKIINHIDGNKSNNNVCNLEWVTYSENSLHSYYVLQGKIAHQKIYKIRGKKVKQLDNNGNVIKIWNSIAEVERELGIANPNITKACKGIRQTAGGFKWSYN